MTQASIFQIKLPALLSLHDYSSTYNITLPQTQDFSISFWFWVQSAKHKQVILYEGQPYSPNWELYVEDNHLFCDWYIDDEPIRVIHSRLESTDQWNLVILRFSNHQLNAYLNGNALSIAEHEAVVQDKDQLKLSVGGYTDPAGGHYDFTFGRDGSGLIDDLRVDSPSLPETYNQYSNSPSIPDANFTTTQHTSKESPFVTFDATGSTSPNGKIQSFIWDYGDGQIGFGQGTDHHYDFDGNYVVKLLCIDNLHKQTIISKHAQVNGKQQSLELNPVFENGKEGYACYRIPAIVRATNGDLLAFAEGRIETCSDATDTIHAVCKRSLDNGKTWQPLQVIAVNPDRQAISAVQNISPVVDTVHDTGRVIVLYNVSEYSEWDLTAGKGVIRTHAKFSDDHGKTWHSETDITSQIHHPYQHNLTDSANIKNRLHDWRLHRPTLGHGLQLSSGRLVFVGTITQGNLSVFQSQNVIFWSDDLGENWSIGGIVPRIGMNEAIAVELENGDLMVNTRAYQDEKPLKRRAVTLGTFTHNNLIAFQETFLDEVLVDSAVQASILRYTDSTQQDYGGKSRILFSNPSHPHARRKMAVRLSYDEGQTWSVNKVVDHGPAAYSDLVIQDDMQIGLLFERGNQGGIWYVNFTLDWLTDEQDSLTQT